MAGYIGSKSSVTQVDGYTEAEADAEFVAKTGDTMSGNLDVTGTVTSDGLTVTQNGSGFTPSSQTVALFQRNSASGSGAKVCILAGNQSSSDLNFGDVDNEDQGALKYEHNNDAMTFTTNGSERMRLDSSGNVGIGLAPSSWWSGMNAVETQASSGGVFASASVNGHFLTNAYYDGSNWKYKNNGAAEYYSQAGGLHQFSTASSGSAGGNITWSERMRIDSSGNTRGGETTNYRGSSNDGLGAWSLGANGNLVGAVYQDIPIIANRMGNDGYAVSIRRRGTQIGGINISGTTTQYITSSDYRLKENLVDLTGASARVNQLNPLRFNWITDDTNTAIDGFLAHEVATVVPEAINGTKDAMRDEEYEVTPAVEATYDEDGNELTAAVEAVMGTRSVPDYQGIDQSKLVPLLTAALQEALTEIASLKTRVEALEA